MLSCVVAPSVGPLPGPWALPLLLQALVDENTAQQMETSLRIGRELLLLPMYKPQNQVKVVSVIGDRRRKSRFFCVT